MREVDQLKRGTSCYGSCKNIMLFEKACIFLQSSAVKARMIKESCSRGEDKEHKSDCTMDVY